MREALVTVGCSVLGYALGSLPISVWLVRWRRRRDVRDVGDGNPGAVNAWKAAGWKVGVAALVLDAAKGAVAPALALWVLAVHGWALLPVALAPSLGHATSPWLRGRGGKAITTTFGVWAALSTWVVPTFFGLFLAGLMLVQSVSAWTVVFAGALTAVALILLRLDAPLVVAFVCSLLFLVWTHRRELKMPPRFGPRARKGA